MEITTRHFGVIEIEEDKLLEFPQGLIGFEDARQFCLIGKPEVAPYRWLQCVNRPELTLVVLPVVSVRPGYVLALNPEERKRFRLEEGEEPILLAIVVVAADPAGSTVNLVAPVVINEQARTGGQIINDAGAYRTRHNLKDELMQAAKEGSHHAGAHPEKETVLNAR